MQGKQGSRLEANRVKVSLTKNGQYTMTIPKALAMAIGLHKGSIMRYAFQKSGEIKLYKEEDRV
jgi:hypothetical protein